MFLRRKYLLYCSVLLTLLFVVVSTNSIKCKDEGRNFSMSSVTDILQKYFPHENSLCVVLGELDGGEFLPTFHVPVVVYTRDKVLQDCGSKLTDMDGYVYTTTNSKNLEEQITPILKCINQTTLRLNTKHILVLDGSINSTSGYHEIYNNFFHNLWKAHGIINIAILPVRILDQDTEPPLVFSYNPFLARHNMASSALRRSPLTHDIRGTMSNQFRDMQGHRLRTLFYKGPNSVVKVEDLYKKHTIGVNTEVLLKQVLEENMNASLDAYEPSDFNIYNWSYDKLMVELISGRAEYCINFALIQRNIKGLNHAQLMATAFTVNFIFVVPKPKQIETWRYFMHIFQWQVCLGLGIVLFSLSTAALIFKYVYLKSNTSSLNSSWTSEVMSVWKAALSISISRLPTTHLQRLITAFSLLLGLIFVTLFGVQVFFLVKSKPREAPLRTLQDLQDSNLPIYAIHKHFASYLNVFENTTLHKLKDNLKTDKMYENAHFLDPKILNITDRAILYAEPMVKLLESTPHNEAFLQVFDVVKEPVAQSLMVVYLPIGSIYYDRINDLNLRLISGGFYKKWFDANDRLMLEQYIASSTIDPRASQGQGSHHTDEDRVPLTYSDLKLAFYILYIGLAVSTLCFLLEICFS